MKKTDHESDWLPLGLGGAATVLVGVATLVLSLLVWLGWRL